MMWMETMRKPSQVAAVFAALVVVVGAGPPRVERSRRSRRWRAAVVAARRRCRRSASRRRGPSCTGSAARSPAADPCDRLPGRRDDDLGGVARLAEALGLTGSVRQDASGWSVQGGDRSLQVQRAGGLPWTLSSSGGGSVSSGCAVASPGSIGGSGVTPPATPAVPPPTCPTTTTVPGLPAKADAERRARDVLTSAGFDLTGATASSTGGIDSWYVSFTATIAGLPVLGAQWSVTVGANGSVLIRIGPARRSRRCRRLPAGRRHRRPAAPPRGREVDRLQRAGSDARWARARRLGGAGGGCGSLPGRCRHGRHDRRLDSGANYDGTTTAVPPTGTAAPSGPPESTPGGGPAIPPSTSSCRPGQPCAPVPTTATPVIVPPVVVTITGVHLALAWAWPLDPSSPDAWLIPVYVFELTGGTAYPFFGNGVPVLAVADRYVAAPPSTTMPTGVTKPGTAPTPNTVVTTPAPSATATK